MNNPSKINLLAKCYHKSYILLTFYNNYIKIKYFNISNLSQNRTKQKKNLKMH
jgi:hypothetical protein